MANLETVVTHLDSFLARAHSGEDSVLLPRQLVTIQKITDFLRAGYREGHITLPTGVGKTVIFTKFLENALRVPQSKGLVVGPTKLLLHQNKWKLDAFGDIAAGRFYGPEKDLSQRLTVTTYHSLRNGIASKVINPHDYSFLILDEAHRALGEETVNVIDQFPETTLKLGFTATPEFHEQKSVADILPVTIDELSLSEAIRSNLLAGLQVYLVQTPVDSSQIAREGKEYASSALTQLVNTPSRNELVVSTYKDNLLFAGKRAVVYCSGRQHAQDMTRHFSENGISAGYVDCSTDEFARERLFSAFKEGSLPVLCNAEVLIESFDEPEAEVCINAVPTLSRVVAEQRGGRVLRRSRLTDGKVGKVLEIVDSFEGNENTPVLFSEIAGAAEILPPHLEKKEQKISSPRTSSPRKPLRPVEVGALVDDPARIMNFTNQNKRQRFTRLFHYAPLGWEHPRQLAHDCGVRESAIQLFAEQTKGNDRSTMKRYLTSTDILLTHYHPSLVDAIRRHFVPELQTMVTSNEYATEKGISSAQARETLEAATVHTSVSPRRYTASTYYPRKETLAVLETERQRVRALEQELSTQAEDAFWNDDERTDDERERDYWDTFAHLQPFEESSLPGVPYNTFTIQYDEDTHQPFIEHASSLLVQRLEDLRHNMQFLHPHYQKILHENYVKGKTSKEIAASCGVTRSAIFANIQEAYKLLCRYIEYDERLRAAGNYIDHSVPTPITQEERILKVRRKG